MEKKILTDHIKNASSFLGYNKIQENGFEYIEAGHGETILILHGLFGGLSNWHYVINKFKNFYNVLVPTLPIYSLPLFDSNLDGILNFLQDFVEHKKLKRFILVGNSLGGHIAILYAIRNLQSVTRLVLTGSSGLFEDTMGGAFPRRSNYDYIADRVKYTFYNPNTIDKEFIDEIFAVTQDLNKALRVTKIAKSAQRNNVANDLYCINIPTLLIWGLNDTITPPQVAHEFNFLIKNSTLKFIDHCCHAPMMEQPQKFNEILEIFLID
jgi:pimeloyl-ACP methyl ester carboxylesterase